MATRVSSKRPNLAAPCLMPPDGPNLAYLFFMKFTSRQFFAVFAAVFALAASSASAQVTTTEAAAPAAPAAPTLVAPDADPDHFALRLGGFFLSSINTRLSLTDASGHGGQEVDFSRDLGGRDNLTLFRADAEWQFAANHKVQLSYFDIDRNASKAIDHTISWGDQTYTINTTLHSEVQQIVSKLNYGYTFYRNAAKTQELTGLIGFHITKMKVEVGSTASGVAEGGDVTAPLPIIGLEWKARLSDKLTSYVAYEYFGLSLDNKYTGSLSDFQAMVEYHLWRHWSLGGGYNRYTSRASVTSERTINNQQLKLSVRHNYNGLMLFVATHF
jgi:hypothetical protein